MNTLRSSITGHDFAGEEITDGNGNKTKLNPDNRVHRVIAQILEEREVREQFPNLTGFLNCADWKIRI